MEDKSPEPTLREDEMAASVHAVRKHSPAKLAVVWVMVLVVFAGLLWLVFSRTGTPQTAAQPSRGAGAKGGAVTVTPATAQKGDIGVYMEAIGTVTPVYTSNVTSQVTGMVVAVHYREGQLVRKGEALVDIDSHVFAAQLAQAEGSLEKDTQVLSQAKMDLERYRSAWARNAISKQTLDDQEKLVLQTRGTVRADQGLVQYDKVQLGYCHIVAPFSGRVGLRLIDPGNVVQANSSTPLAVVTQQQPITVIFTVAEDAIGQIQAQLRHGGSLPVEAYDRAAQTKLATGKLLTMDNQIDTTTGTVKLRAAFDNKDGALFPNQFVNTRLLVKTLKGVTLIPTSAIQHNAQTSFVYLIKDGVAEMRTVNPGVAEAGLTAVEGIQPGDVVANSSFEKLQPGVKVLPPKAPQQGSQGGENKNWSHAK
jgi:multidrug efflux system membrane fusion protein